METNDQRKSTREVGSESRVRGGGGGPARGQPGRASTGRQQVPPGLWEPDPAALLLTLELLVHELENARVQCIVLLCRSK